MIFKYIRSDLNVADKDFDKIYPKRIQKISNMHFTPVQVAKFSASYLAEEKGTKILDIGSGAGKFCMIGSACTEGDFVGIEQRKSLCTIAKKVSKRYNLKNVEFINANITDICFKNYDAFYFFNSFQENNSFSGAIDNKIILNRELFIKYTNYVKEQLDSMPKGTKLVTYYSFLKEIPDNYKMKISALEHKLKFWEKIL
ncbi:MAG: methyltransferase domain-containing protein [Saprospiraceae bacterium]